MTTTRKTRILLADHRGLVLEGIKALRSLRALLPPSRLLCLTMRQNAAMARQALQLGVSGYVLKSASSLELIHAIREVAAGRTYFAADNDKALAGSENPYSRRMDSRRMNLRQREVIQLLAEGGSMKEVASVLKITARTVAYHKYTVMQQHQLKTNAELIQFAIRQQMVAV